MGDFYPLPINSLNEIAAGTKTSRCRPCFRTGSKTSVDVTKTRFEDASFASLHIDTCFQQCLHVGGGPTENSLPFMHNSIFNFREKMQEFQLLTSSTGGSVSDLQLEDFQKLTPGQACSLLYFSYFPRALDRVDANVDIRYDYDGTAWSETGGGPYFKPKPLPAAGARSSLPQESVEVFISSEETTPDGRLPSTSDVALIGPNSQAYIRLRPLEVFGVPRYDMSVSSTNFVDDSLKAQFGYWRIFAIYTGFPRLIQDSILESESYPAQQWLVDFLGYFGMFTGFSFFGLLLVPVLASMRRAERRRLREERPEAVVWSRYRQEAQWRSSRDPELTVDEPGPELPEGKNPESTRGIHLP